MGSWKSLTTFELTPPYIISKHVEGGSRGKGRGGKGCGWQPNEVTFLEGRKVCALHGVKLISNGHHHHTASPCRTLGLELRP